MTDDAAVIPPAVYEDVALLWDYNQLHHELRPCSVGVGLGSHDLRVATLAAELFHQGMFPLVVFTGANAPTTVQRFPEGEAIHYRRHAVELGVPPEAILVENRAMNTKENIELSRDLLRQHGIHADSVLLICRPYQQRRAYATARTAWPDVEVVCASQPASLPEYVAGIGDAKLVVDMIVGDTQRVIEYPKLGHAAEQEVPSEVQSAVARLMRSGFTGRQVTALPIKSERC